MNLDHLNEKQREAVLQTEGPLLILAGAGSGKTATMTHRIAYLVENGVKPYRILAVTFTNKAAAEMRERVEKLIGHTPGMWILTFHSMCLRILREHYSVVGYKENFVVYDTVDKKTVIKNITKEQNLDPKIFSQPYLASVISKQKEEDIGPEEYRKINIGNPKSQKVYEVYKEYEKQLMKNNAMDFDDLLRYGLHVLEKDETALEQYRNRFQYVMVDEYQDTNYLQYQMIKLIAEGSGNLCVVGDDDQCIYQWRGADLRNILDFEKDFPKARVIKLEQNYRSHGNILEAAYSVIKNNKGRKEKKLWTDREDGHKIVYRRADSDKEEAQFVANEIKILSNRRGYNDFAVLYRTNAQSRLLEDGLRRKQIPYKILSGFSFYERKETKDMISYMRLVVNPSDDISLERVINQPKRGMGAVTLDKLRAFAQVENTSLFELLGREEIIESLSKKAGPQVREFVELIQGCRREKETLSLGDIYDLLLVKSGYMKSLEEENTVEAEGKVENLLDFRSFIVDFENEKKELNEEATLEEFLERVSTASDTDQYDESAESVTLMTIHSAKGLEFPVVFMVGMEDGLFPSQRSMDTEEGMEEERRLCYVGMTRAKERLFLTSAKYRMMYGHGDYTIESSFLREVDSKLFDLQGDGVYKPNPRTNSRLGMDTGKVDGFSQEVYKPYNPLQYAKKQIKEKEKEFGHNFSVGESVTHKKFGFGVVIEIDDKTVTVKFEDGKTLKLAKAIAPLKKV